MAETVYLLCAATSLLCAAMLFRGYRRSGFRLLMWSALCFFCMTLGNAALFVDLALFPLPELRLWWNLPVLAGLLLLIFGLVWESD